MYRKRVKYPLYFAFCMLCYFILLPVTLTIDGLQFMLMLLLLPAAMLIGSAIWGYFYKFDLVPPLMSALLFLPSVYLFLNDTALIYCLIYGLVALLGTALGHIGQKYIKP